MSLKKIQSYFKNIFKKKSSQDALLICLVFIIAVLSLFWGEKILEIGIFGDEVDYRNIARDFPAEIFEKGQKNFRLQRILPSFLIYYGVKFLNQPHNDQTLIFAFGICSVFVITLSSWIWCLIADLLHISQKGKWIGFLALFLNYPILKQAFYNPVSTDYFAYLLGFLLLFFYLSDNFFGIYISSLFAVFCWPTLTYISVILCAFPREKKGQSNEAPVKLYLNYWVALAVAGYLFYRMQYWFGEYAEPSFATGIFSTGTNHPIVPLLSFSKGLSLCYVFFGLAILLNTQKIFSPHYVLQNISVLRPLILVLFLFGIRFFLYHVSVKKYSVYSFMYLLKDTLGTSVMAPMLFLLSHIVFYGPFIILLVLFWGQTARLIQEQGLGLIICCAICIVLSLNSESRKIINFYPFFIPFLIKILDDMRWPSFYYAFLTILSLFASKFWLTVHNKPWEGESLAFPKQNYFMHYGPWMNSQMYQIQGAIVLAFFVVLFVMFKWDPFRLKGMRKTL